MKLEDFKNGDKLNNRFNEQMLSGLVKATRRPKEPYSEPPSAWNIPYYEAFKQMDETRRKTFDSPMLFASYGAVTRIKDNTYHDRQSYPVAGNYDNSTRWNAILMSVAKTSKKADQLSRIATRASQFSEKLTEKYEVDFEEELTDELQGIVKSLDKNDEKRYRTTYAGAGGLTGIEIMNRKDISSTKAGGIYAELILMKGNTNNYGEGTVKVVSKINVECQNSVQVDLRSSYDVGAQYVSEMNRIVDEAIGRVRESINEKRDRLATKMAEFNKLEAELDKFAKKEYTSTYEKMKLQASFNGVI